MPTSSIVGSVVGSAVVGSTNGSSGDRRRYLALAPRPTEALVAAELAELADVTDIEPLVGAVAFHGPRAALYRANLWLRCATRVLLPVADFPCRGERDLYDQARAVPWERYVRPSGTVAVRAHGQVPGLQNSMFTAVRVKDAIADRFLDRGGQRPSVDTGDPDLAVNVQLYEAPQQAGSTRASEDRGPRCALALDSSGQALHRRGYRKAAGAAPMKETLAAALVALTGYGQAQAEREGPPVPLVDLCCGSGTLLIEAGLWALRRAPGLSRPFGFERWLDHDAVLWRSLLEEAQARIRPAPGPFLFGSDVDPAMVDTAGSNAAAAGLPSARFTCADLGLVRPPITTGGPPGVVLCNPPYGERMGDETALIPLYRSLGDTLKRHFKGYTAYVYTANLALGRQIGLRPSQRHVVYNGNLEGRLLRFDLY